MTPNTKLVPGLPLNTAPLRPDRVSKTTLELQSGS